MSLPSAQWRVVWPLAIGLLLSGCADGGGSWFGRKPPPEEPPAPRGAGDRTDVVVAGTVGEQTLLSNAAPLPLRGFGLVVGLHGRGSSDCPTIVRDYLIEQFSKTISMPGERERQPRISPTRLIDSANTAVVEVIGSVPAGAVKGTHFDVQVRAVLGSSTESLAGGLLLPTSLRLFDASAAGRALIAGKVLAEAQGPLFVNPFRKADSPDIAEQLRTGQVLGGGVAIEPRPARLVLQQPNYRLARDIERRVNERFGQQPAAAEAMSRGYVMLHTPTAYTRDPAHFLALARFVQIDNRPIVIERKLSALTPLMIAGQTPRESIALVWEGLGRAVLPELQPLYAHPDPAVRYYAARSGLRVGDNDAISALGAIAATPEHPFRLYAVRELGEATSPQAGVHLAPLLDDADQEVRIAAYEALMQRGHPRIRPHIFRHVLDPSQVNFILDVVESSGPPLIYMRRTQMPRLALFGRHMSIMPPVFYVPADDSLTVHTVSGSDDIRLYAKAYQRLSDELVVPPLVDDLVHALAALPLRDDAENLQGLGLTYAQVIQVLAALANDHCITARLVQEQTPTADIFGPEGVPERAEGAPPAPAPTGDAGEPAPGWFTDDEATFEEREEAAPTGESS
jgi:hypothetical protein